MAKNVLVISSTMRKNGNSEVLAQEFAKGAKVAGNNVEFITLRDRDIKFCKGCMACQSLKTCVIKDDSNEVVEKMKNADVIAFASPIYYYEMSGQLKTLLDRGNPLYSLDYKFKDIYFLATSADTNPHSADIAANGIKGWISCFAGVELKDVILGAGAEGVGDIANNPAMQQAYNAGLKV